MDVCICKKLANLISITLIFGFNNPQKKNHTDWVITKKCQTIYKNMTSLFGHSHTHTHILRHEKLNNEKSQ